MTLFWIICALLLVVASLFIALPLWRSTVKNKQVQRDAANLEIFRDQVAEMDTDLRNGLLTPELYEQGKRELQARLLDEVKETESAGKLSLHNPHKTLAIALIALLPVLSIALYWKLGNQDVFLPQATHADNITPERLESAIKELENRVAKNPQDIDSLHLLARSYAGMERYAESVKAYEKLTTLLPKEAQLWADFADVAAMENRRNLAGRPTALLNKALELDPDNLKGLALAGSAAMVRGDYPATLRYWERLLKLIPKDTEDAKMVEGGIQQVRNAMAQAKGGKPVPLQSEASPAKSVAPGQERITGTVTLSDELKGKAKPDDLLFVLARAAEGPKMPLAVMRMQVKDLPLQFTLDDSMAMSPQMKLSNFDKVVVVARVSTSGDPMSHPGDLEGMSPTLKPGSTGVKLNIGTIVK